MIPLDREIVYGEVSAERAATGFVGYRLDLRTIYESGDRRHPSYIAREWFPDAADIEPVPIGDCWLFNTKAPREDAPPAFTKLSRPHAHSIDVWDICNGKRPGPVSP